MKAKIFYGRHMEQGVARYVTPDGEHTIVILEEVLKRMDPTMNGSPVYVEHVDGVPQSVSKMKNEADGIVIESFYNKWDGAHWTKFAVFTEEGLNKIASGWRLSNAYQILDSKDIPGKWHNVEYDREVLSGEYEHLAIVENPRYESSIILTPEEFKEYNLKKEKELETLKNSKDEDKGAKEMKNKFTWFKREKVTNDLQDSLESAVVKLPKSGIEVEVAKVLNEKDEAEAKKKENEGKEYANVEHFVKLDEKEEMSVNDLVSKYKEQCKKNNEKEDLENEDDEDEKENESDDDKENEGDEDEKENEIGETAGSKQFTKDIDPTMGTTMGNKPQNSKGKNLNKLKNANKNAALFNSLPIVETDADKLKRGRDRY